MKKILILIVCLFCLTGCYNYLELDKLAVVSSIFIDYDNEYKISIEVFAEEDEVEIFEGSGETITTALLEAEAESEKKLYYRHINAVIITDNVDVPDIIYFFFRNADTNDNFAFVNTDKDKIYEDTKVNIGELIKNNIEDDDLCSFFEIMKGYVNNIRDLAIPSFDGKKLSGIKSYKDTTPIYNFSSDETEIFRVLKNKDDAYLRNTCDKETFVININDITTKYKITDKITIEIILKTSIEELNCDLDITKTTDLKKLEKYANENLQKRVSEFINKLKEDQTDILGINTLIKNKYHTLDKKFDEYDYEVKTDISIYKKGLLLK